MVPMEASCTLASRMLLSVHTIHHGNFFDTPAHYDKNSVVRAFCQIGHQEINVLIPHDWIIHI